MNQMILKIASLPNGYKTGRAEDPGSGKGSKGFFSTIQRLMKSVQRRSPLNRISLNSQDLPILKKFLYQCGLSQEGVERLLRELAGDNPHGGINLSQLFLKIAELGPPDRRIDQAITLEPSAIPYIESALRDFGLTPRQIENALSAARVEGGGLDLDRFVIKIKEISNRIRGGTQAVIDRNSVQEISKNLQRAGIQLPDKGEGGQISKNLQRAGIQLPDKGEGGHVSKSLQAAAIQTADNGKGQVSIEDFITAIEQMKGRSARRDQLPIERQSLLSSLEGKGGSKNEKNGQQKIEPPNPIRRFSLPSSLDTGRELTNAVRQEGNSVKPETSTQYIPRDIISSTFSETINTVKQNQVPVRDFLPAYVMDQVGKQISRSILRGERVIRLQLRPPELGVLKVEMDIKDNILKLWMITENSSVKELLLSNAHELREALVGQGVKLDRLDIQINYNFDHSLANSKEGLKDGQGQGINGAPFTAEDDTDDGLSGPRDGLTDDHLLDLVA
jgi:hypothetical protein